MKKALTIPNQISILRIILAPLLLLAAFADQPLLFLALFIVSLLSDALDGFLARRLHLVSEWGAQLDSWGDVATYLVVPPGVWLLWPALVRQERVAIILGITGFLVPIFLGFIKFKRLTSYHTWATKGAAILLGFAAPPLLLGGPAWPFRLAIVIFLLAEMEEVAITIRLSAWQANIPSLWHLRRLRSR